jgi:hypothetical protein
VILGYLGGKAMAETVGLAGRHDKIIEEMGKIKAMRKGTLSPTWRDVVHKDGEVVTKGPYYVLTRKESGGKTQTRSIPAGDVARVREEVDNYRRFRQLADEYIEVCEAVAMAPDDRIDGAKKTEHCRRIRSGGKPPCRGAALTAGGR